jgi:hypothetical protein
MHVVSNASCKQLILLQGATPLVPPFPSLLYPAITDMPGQTVVRSVVVNCHCLLLAGCGSGQCLDFSHPQVQSQQQQQQQQLTAGLVTHQRQLLQCILVAQYGVLQGYDTISMLHHTAGHAPYL